MADYLQFRMREAEILDRPGHRFGELMKYRQRLYKFLTLTVVSMESSTGYYHCRLVNANAGLTRRSDILRRNVNPHTNSVKKRITNDYVLSAFDFSDDLGRFPPILLTHIHDD